ncbi:MAG: GNAT family N-acetyltransferase [Rhizobiales bacterium]|nr:GNAT family N-acetyltransferase [Hyphomicrobiales bacterium]
MRRAGAADGLDIRPLTPELWDDLADLFGPRGASSGCWCMWTRLTRPEWRAAGAEGRREAFARIVAQGPAPGLLGYREGKPVAWVAVAPRAATPRFDAMDKSAPVGDVDPARIFAITCFYIRAGARRSGLMRAMARAAADHARAAGAAAVEVCAIEADRPLAWGEGFVGVASVFRDLGFVEVARRTPRRPLMRLAF